MKNKKTDNSSGVKLATLGTGLVGLAATTYFFLAPKGQKHQKHAKAWIIKMKVDVIKKLEATRDISQSTYKEIIDSIAKDYTKNKKVGDKEIKKLTQDLKKHWKTISGGVKTIKSEVIKNTKKATGN